MKNKLLATSIFFSITLFALPSLTYACSCVSNNTIVDYVERSDYIFTGTVKNIIEKEPKDEMSIFIPQTTVEFEGVEAINNSVNTIYTNDNSAACGYNFEVGQEYVVFASEIEGRPEVSLCSGTQVYNEVLVSELMEYEFPDKPVIEPYNPEPYAPEFPGEQFLEEPNTDQLQQDLQRQSELLVFLIGFSILNTGLLLFNAFVIARSRPQAGNIVSQLP